MFYSTDRIKVFPSGNCRVMRLKILYDQFPENVIRLAIKGVKPSKIHVRKQIYSAKEAWVPFWAKRVFFFVKKCKNWGNLVKYVGKNDYFLDISYKGHLLVCDYWVRLSGCVKPNKMEYSLQRYDYNQEFHIKYCFFFLF